MKHSHDLLCNSACTSHDPACLEVLIYGVHTRTPIDSTMNVEAAIFRFDKGALQQLRKLVEAPLITEVPATSKRVREGATYSVEDVVFTRALTLREERFRDWL
jgi:hypothetical protein